MTVCMTFDAELTIWEPSTPPSADNSQSPEVAVPPVEPLFTDFTSVKNPNAGVECVVEQSAELAHCPPLPAVATLVSVALTASL